MKKIGFISLIVMLVFAGCLISCASTSEESEKNDISEVSSIKQATPAKQESPASIENLELKTIEITTPKDGIIRERYTCTYGSTVRSFIVCKAAKSSPKALILMLHGYAGSGESFMNDISFDEKAANENVMLLFVDGIPDPDDKTSASGWNSGLKDSSKDDLGFLKALAKTFQAEYSISRERTFAAGFSNGAFMIHRLAVEASERFGAFASVAGFLPESVWNRRPERISAAFLQINGTKDDVVPMNATGTAKFNKNPAIEDVIEYYKSASPNPDRIKHIIIEGGRHSWPEEKFCGFDVDKVILDFFLERK